MIPDYCWNVTLKTTEHFSVRFFMDNFRAVRRLPYVAVGSQERDLQIIWTLMNGDCYHDI